MFKKSTAKQYITLPKMMMMMMGSNLKNRSLYLYTKDSVCVRWYKIKISTALK